MKMLGSHNLRPNKCTQLSKNEGWTAKNKNKNKKHLENHLTRCTWITHFKIPQNKKKNLNSLITAFSCRLSLFLIFILRPNMYTHVICIGKILDQPNLNLKFKNQPKPSLKAVCRLCRGRKVRRILNSFFFISLFLALTCVQWSAANTMAVVLDRRSGSACHYPHISA